MIRSFIMIFSLILFLLCESPVGPGKKENYLPELVFIHEDLTFTMGRLDLPDWMVMNRYDPEYPAFLAKLDPYYIGKYEVRNDEYKFFVDDGGYSDSTLWSKKGWDFIVKEKRSRPKGWTEREEPWKDNGWTNTADRPVGNVTWYEAEAYCNWLSRKTGDRYDLPTEAQWERAAKGPDPARKFSWGNDYDTTKFNNPHWPGRIYPVDSYGVGKSVEGCYNMCGNVEEHCKDFFDLCIYRIYKKNEPVLNPFADDSSKIAKSYRGCWYIYMHDFYLARQITTYLRGYSDPKRTHETLGFRVVKNTN